MRAALVWLLSAWLALTPAFADSSFVAPTATGTAATGQIPGTTTNDSANAGNIGEYRSAITTSGTSTVTITNAAPGVVSWTAHNLGVASGLNFTTTGGGTLPTQYVAGTNYYVCTVPDANSFTVASSVANAIAGTCITTSGGSGTVTAASSILLTSAQGADITGISLTAGNWLCSGSAVRAVGATTTLAGVNTGINSTTATLPTTGTTAGRTGIASAPTGGGLSMHVQPVTVKNSATTTWFLVVLDVFGISTNSTTGSIVCWRIR